MVTRWRSAPTGACSPRRRRLVLPFGYSGWHATPTSSARTSCERARVQPPDGRCSQRATTVRTCGAATGPNPASSRITLRGETSRRPRRAPLASAGAEGRALGGFRHGHQTPTRWPTILGGRCCFRPDGRLLASAGAMDRCACGDSRRAPRPASSMAHILCAQVAFSTDGPLARKRRETVCVLLDSRRHADARPRGPQVGSHVAFGPRGAARNAGDDGSVRLWDPRRAPDQFRGAHGLGTRSRSSRRGPAASVSGRCAWDVTAGTQTRVLEGHTDWARSAFTRRRCSPAPQRPAGVCDAGRARNPRFETQKMVERSRSAPTGAARHSPATTGLCALGRHGGHTTRALEGHKTW